MAATKIADVIVPEVFNGYVQERTPDRSELWTSGIVQTVQGLSILGSRGGTTITMPFWDDLDGEEEILSDTVPLGVDKITADQDIAVLNARGKAWGVNDLAKALSGDDPMARIADLVVDFWSRRWQVMLLAILEGIFASGDLTSNISDVSGESGDAGTISGTSIIDALYKLGDAVGRLSAFAMHSATVASLAKQGLIEFRLDAEANPTIPFYMGKRVLMDDTLPGGTELSPNGVITTYIFGQGAFGFGEGNAPVPTETDRDSLQGEDILINRRHFVLHPRGVRWVGTPTGVSPTNVEFRDGDNWELVWNPKNVRIVQFKHRLA
jgi:hypothetical protein